MGSGKKGGSSGSSVSDFNIPQGLLQGAASTSGLGQYGTSILNPLAAMTSWASSLATGQNVQVATPEQYATQAGPGASFKGGKEWSTQFDPTTGQVTFTNPGNPRQTFEMGVNDPQLKGVISESYLSKWQQAANSYQQYQASQGTKTTSTAQMTDQQKLAWQDIQAEQEATKQMSGIEAQTQKAIDQATADQAKYAAQGDVEQQQAQAFYKTGDVQEQQAQQLYGVGYQELSDADKQIVDAHALVKMTTTGEGLFPAQQAMIEQARQSEETQLASTLGAAGLGRSTQLGQLTGAVDLASAATAGQLQQGNIQAAEQVLSGALGEQAGAQKTLGLAQTQEQAAAQTYGLGQTQEQVAQKAYELSQASQKISLAGQELLAGEQAQLSQELANISDQSSAFQKQLWDEAMSGYGMMGDILSRSSQSYGYSLDAYKSVLSAMEQHDQTQAQQQQASMSADSSATSSLFGALGKILGSAGGAVAGGSAAAAGGGAAAAGGGSALGGIISGVGSALSALFCEVAQEVYGFDNPAWERFRKWLLFRGPRWFLHWYGKNARHVAAWLKDKPRIKWFLACLMDAIAR